ncbi:hypothetical protein GO755_39060 [Spirosoma sp. HMF4905]|uniref:Uncharacterized protein n=1 Tax=Spirosoma arboris TaxID=2682092 RepID=A0A7K1SQL3_9BACT|nr:hypothetical protein [Spirosoma arboris]MVM36079.1 hypothetical protein [Spirosoma arboris]
MINQPIPLKTTSEICIAADAAQSITEIHDLWKSVVANGYQYPLVEIKFIKEHLTERARDMGRRDGTAFRIMLTELGIY